MLVRAKEKMKEVKDTRQGVQMTTKQVEEMRRLRKEGGYTIGEIAKHIGCSQHTVSKYIGHDNGRTHYKAPDGVPPTANLKIVHQQMTIQGNKNVYQLSPSDGVMVYREISYSVDELKILIAELSELLNMMEKGKKPNEKDNENAV